MLKFISYLLYESIIALLFLNYFHKLWIPEVTEDFLSTWSSVPVPVAHGDASAAIQHALALIQGGANVPMQINTTINNNTSPYAN